MSLSQEMSRLLQHHPVHRLVRSVDAAVAKVILPASQALVQVFHYLWPGPFVTVMEDGPHAFPQALDRLLRRGGPQVPSPTSLVDHWAAAVAQEVERLTPRLPDTGLLLVDGQPNPAHNAPRPVEGSLRMPTTQDDEVIG